LPRPKPTLSGEGFTAESVVIAGDSSGRNLALSTIAWARDTQRQSADAIVALCPQTDATLSGPSLKQNTDSDVMQ
ncbi:MAG: alpha/beta hydrolase fold domain-containing protein, partial [Planctomycetota bacterium]